MKQKSKPSVPENKETIAPFWQEAHEQACQKGEALYPDPETGLWVFTRVGLLDRGYCCHSGCRHCPYPENANS